MLLFRWLILNNWDKLFMNLIAYEFSVCSNEFEYSFNSVGKNGIVKKVAQFIPSSHGNVFQFRFGDYDASVNKIEDNVATRNNDAEMVINTIALILVDFTKKYPGCMVRFSSIDKIRIRLYSIWIFRHWDWLCINLLLFGFRNKMWERCRKGIQYSAYIVKAG